MRCLFDRIESTLGRRTEAFESPSATHHLKQTARYPAISPTAWVTPGNREREAPLSDRTAQTRSSSRLPSKVAQLVTQFESRSGRHSREESKRRFFLFGTVWPPWAAVAWRRMPSRASSHRPV